MASRYTFRITRKTRWLEDIIESVEKKDQSDFIREMVIAGIQACHEMNQESSDNRQTFGSRLSADCQTIDRQFADIVNDDEDDLDSKLEGMYA